MESNKPVFFFSSDPPRTYYLSQWFESSFSNGDNNFATCEMYMMWAKAMLFGDEETAQKILKAPTPRKQKGLGRKVQNFDEKKWDENKSRIVEDGNYLKFSQCTTVRDGNTVSLKDLLMMTGDREPVEASPFDRVWGIGFSVKDAPDAPREKWGENLLGKALMRVRARLREETEAKAKSNAAP